MSLNEIIESVIENNTISLNKINNLNLSDDQYDELIKILQKRNIDIIDCEPIGKMENVFCEDSYRQYMNEISKIPLLTPEQEREIVLKIQQKDLPKKEREEYRQLLIKSNLRWVTKIASKYMTQNCNTSFSLLDIIQEGNIGLMKAVDRFDCTLGYKFSTYSYWWIRQSIGKALSTKSKTIRIPHNLYQKVPKIINYIEEYKSKNNKFPTAEECSLLFDISITEADLLLKNNYEILSLDSPINTEDESDSLENFVVDEKNKSDYDKIEDDMLIEKLYRKMSEVLSRKELEIVLCRIGKEYAVNNKIYGSNAPMTLDEIGKSMGVTRERIRQIESKAFRKMKCNLEIRTNLKTLL